MTRILATEMGKNLAEARGDVLKAIEVVECACSTHYLMSGDTIMNVSSGYDTVSYREPMGVFAGIVPFNFPDMIQFGWLIPFANTTGNTYVLKAASMVPRTAMRMLELLQEAGLPDGDINLLPCMSWVGTVLPPLPKQKASLQPGLPGRTKMSNL